MKVADAVAEILKREGVDTLVAYPVNPIIEAAAAADVRTIIVRQERTGIHMADAYSRLHSGRRLGVFAMQHGPGAENSFGGIAQCYSESVPVLILPAGYSRRQMTVDPNYSSFLNLQHVTKLSEVLLAGGHTPEVLRRAFSALRNGRGRPVSVEIPVDVFGEEVPEPLDYTPTFATRSGPDPADVSRAAELIAAAERPVLYVGQGVHYARAWDELRELAELLAIPVTASLEGKSAFPEDHPLYLGCGGRSMPKAVRTFLDEADLIVGMGVSFTRTGFGVRMPSKARLIHCTQRRRRPAEGAPRRAGPRGRRPAHAAGAAGRAQGPSARGGRRAAGERGGGQHRRDQRCLARRVAAPTGLRRHAPSTPIG